jgi:hypothetical protein
VRREARPSAAELGPINCGGEFLGGLNPAAPEGTIPP